MLLPPKKVDNILKYLGVKKKKKKGFILYNMSKTSEKCLKLAIIKISPPG